MEPVSGGIQPDRRPPVAPPPLRVLQGEGSPAPSKPALVESVPAEPSLWTQAVAVPNLFTYLRLLAVPVFLWAYLRGEARLALALFIGAAATDGVDGFLARVLQQKTRLGGVLDPVADKLLTLTAAIALVLHQRLPIWFLGLALLKDTCITLAVAMLRRRGKPIPSSPSRFGKYATFTLAATLTLALVREATRDPVWDGYVAATALLAMQCVSITIVQYFVRWRRLMQAP